VTPKLITFCLGLTLACAPSTAQDGRPVAFVNARILTMAGDPIAKGTLLVRNGVIAEVGTDVEIPAGTRVIDAAGQTIMPGLVSAWSQAGMGGGGRAQTMTRGRGRGGFRPSGPSRSSSNATNKAAAKVADEIYARQDVFGDLLSVGVTTLALTPSGAGFPGTAALLNPAGKDREGLVRDDDAFLVVGMGRNTATKKLLTETFDKAKKVVEERNKPKEEPKPEKPAEAAKDDAPKEAPKEGDGGKTPPTPKPDDPKPTPKPDEPKPDEPKPDPKPDEQKPSGDRNGGRPNGARPAREARKDPNLEVLADLLQKKRRAFVMLTSAADVVHYLDAVGDDLEFPMTVVATRVDGNSGHFDLVLDSIKNWKGAILMPPSMSTVERTAYAKNPAAEMHAAGVPVGFILGDNKGTVRGVFFRLMELVRHGLPAEAALAGVTRIPAEALGVAGEVGTIEAGKKANLLVFQGDPLDPLGSLSSVWIEGQKVNGASN